jgi:hypothetical protein
LVKICVLMPKDLIDAGAFSDPDIYDEVAGIRITRLVQGHLDGIRDSTGKKNEDNESEGEKNQEEIVEDN